MITIDEEAYRQLHSPLDLTRKSRKYRTKSGLYTVPSPSLETLEKNLFYILKNSVEVLFNKKYIMKPSYLSFDEYGTPFLGDTLMYVNGVYCIEDFDLETVVIPSISALIKINEDNLSSYDNTRNIGEIEW